jgi:cytochrome c oxidase cbb3-type subunit I/II
MSDRKITLEFSDKTVRQFLLASVIWGAVGMLVGVLIASQLNFWRLNFNLPWLTFGRLRPLHTNAVIFALVGNMMFAGIYYSTQRLVKARLASDFLSALHFWGWQAIIVAAAITLPLGFFGHGCFSRGVRASGHLLISLLSGFFSWRQSCRSGKCVRWPGRCCCRT